MHTGFLTWLASFPQGTAAIIGPLVGSALGLIALLLGALFNAYLSRRRDDRIMNHEIRSVATALRAELHRVSRGLIENARVLAEHKGDGKLIIPDIAQALRVLSNAIDKIGLLDEETIGEVIEARIVIEQYFGTLMLHGGEEIEYGAGRRSVKMPSSFSSKISAMNLSVNDIVQRAIERLSAYTQ